MTIRCFLKVNAIPDVKMLSLFLSQYLSCLTTSRSLTDKLAFDVGLQEDSTGGFRCCCYEGTACI